MSSIVKQRSVTFVNNTQPAKITEKDLDLDTCYKDDEIVVKIHSAALNPMDYILHHMATKWIASRKSKTYGMDYAGEIVRRGTRVETKWQIGDHINGQLIHGFDDKGTLSDYLVFKPCQYKGVGHMKTIDYLNEDITNRFNQFDISTSYPLVFATAYIALFGHGQKLGPNSKILVNGASTAVSNCLIQIAKKHLNVGTVVGVCNSNSFEYNKKAGFDRLFAYNEPKMMDKIQNYIKDEMEGEKFDMIFDSVGTSQYYPVIHSLMKPRKEDSYYVAVVGKGKQNYHGGLLDMISNYPVKHIVLSHNPWRTYNYIHTRAKAESNFMELAALMISRKQFIPPLDSVFELKDFEKAIEKSQSNRAKGKIVIRINED
ncbi:hypothetical protein MOUN0_J00276 [Monosporozyma unispora]|nr:zinc ion binding [Kazachstania unispora]